jgi:hypothetical protein
MFLIGLSVENKNEFDSKAINYEKYLADKISNFKYFTEGDSNDFGFLCFDSNYTFEELNDTFLKLSKDLDGSFYVYEMDISYDEIDKNEPKVHGHTDRYQMYYGGELDSGIFE